MPRYEPRNPKVQCANCETWMTKYRTSTTGEYFCRADDCQAERRRRWQKRRTEAKTTEQDRAHADELANTARLLMLALWAPRIQCPVCGLINALPDWPHFDQFGNGCNGTGGGLTPGYTLAHANAIWPHGKREYGEVAE